MAENEPKPKIIVDEDWKAQAQAEKEKLAAEVDQPKERPGAGPAPGGGRGEYPPPSFASLVELLAAQVFYALGGMEDPRTHRRLVDLGMAKHHIDLLAVLEQKTKGNLTEEEKKLLDRALYEARMQYVEIAQRVAAM